MNNEMLTELKRSLSVPLSASETRRRQAVREGLPSVEAFYRKYLNETDAEPYYQMSAKH